MVASEYANLAPQLQHTLIGPASHCKRAAEVHMMTSKEEIEDSYDDRYKAFCKRLLACRLNPGQPEQFPSPSCLRAVNKSDFLSVSVLGGIQL
jgi:hypothetical protein